MGGQGWPPPHTPDPESWTDPVATRPIAQHARQRTAYSFPTGLFVFLAGVVVGMLIVAAVAADRWGVW